MGTIAERLLAGAAAPAQRNRAPAGWDDLTAGVKERERSPHQVGSLAVHGDRNRRLLVGDLLQVFPEVGHRARHHALGIHGMSVSPHRGTLQPSPLEPTGFR